MKRVNYIMILLLAVGITVSCSKDDLDSSELALIDAKSQRGADQGNGAASGAHYNLNIIGVEKDKTADMTGNNGHRIFVGFEGKIKIKLTEGDDFQVMDANGTDGEASFQLPNPDPDGDGMTSYSIWIRPLGSGGSATITLCADADLTDSYMEVCTADLLEVERTRGTQPRFTDESKKLLTIRVDQEFTFKDGDGQVVTVKAGTYSIFDENFEDYFWYYDNNGLRILQLRFYEMSSDIS